ncbi:MAG: HAD family hydrolase [Bacteroidales bacterium]
MDTHAVFFDVDFTLIYPGPRFQREGYEHCCARHGLSIDGERFRASVAAASSMLDEADGLRHDPRLFIDYTKRIIQGMGGEGPGLEACARELFDEWAVCQHFSLFDDVEPVFRALTQRGLRIGLISNTHRSLASFQSHFELEPFVTGAISSSQHGFLKPHASIFRAALDLLGVDARASVMVGDNPAQDIAGALAVGMRAVLLQRAGTRPPWCDAAAPDVPVISTLHELLALL